MDVVGNGSELASKYEAIERYARNIEGMIIEHLAAHFPRLPDSGETDGIELKFGKRYAKLIRVTTSRTGSSRSVYGFVDIDTGDILKPAGWKAPAKHARGNINDASGGMDCSGPWGIAYMS
jgi:hypothetical protein